MLTRMAMLPALALSAGLLTFTAPNATAFDAIQGPASDTAAAAPRFSSARLPDGCKSTCFRINNWCLCW